MKQPKLTMREKEVLKEYDEVPNYNNDIYNSTAGKAHPFKGGMKGGLAFFLKA